METTNLREEEDANLIFYSSENDRESATVIAPPSLSKTKKKDKSNRKKVVLKVYDNKRDNKSLKMHTRNQKGHNQNEWETLDL